MQYLIFAIIMIGIWVIVPLKKRNFGQITSIFYFCIAGIMLFGLILTKFTFREWIPPWNAHTTTATIRQLGDEIRTEREQTDFLILMLGKSNVKELYYKRTITYSYVVDGVEYTKNDTLKSTNKNDVENINKYTIEITYNEKKPDNVIIDNTAIDSTDLINIITIIIFIVMGIILKIGSTPLKKIDLDKSHSELMKTKISGKDTLLKVLKIENIDYERERVFFESQDNRIYCYETDFGEEFKENQIYEIKLNRYNQEKTKIEYEENIIKSIKIVNTEKREFISMK